MHAFVLFGGLNCYFVLTLDALHGNGKCTSTKLLPDNKNGSRRDSLSSEDFVSVSDSELQNYLVCVKVTSAFAESPKTPTIVNIRNDKCVSTSVGNNNNMNRAFSYLKGTVVSSIVDKFNKRNSESVAKNVPRYQSLSSKLRQQFFKDFNVNVEEQKCSDHVKDWNQHFNERELHILVNCDNKVVEQTGEKFIPKVVNVDTVNMVKTIENVISGIDVEIVRISDDEFNLKEEADVNKENNRNICNSNEDTSLISNELNECGNSRNFLKRELFDSSKENKFPSDAKSIYRRSYSENILQKMKKRKKVKSRKSLFNGTEEHAKRKRFSDSDISNTENLIEGISVLMTDDNLAGINANIVTGEINKVEEAVEYDGNKSVAVGAGSDSTFVGNELNGKMAENFDVLVQETKDEENIGTSVRDFLCEKVSTNLEVLSKNLRNDLNKNVGNDYTFVEDLMYEEIPVNREYLAQVTKGAENVDICSKDLVCEKISTNHKICTEERKFEENSEIPAGDIVCKEITIVDDDFISKDVEVISCIVENKLYSLECIEGNNTTYFSVSALSNRNNELDKSDTVHLKYIEESSKGDVMLGEFQTANIDQIMSKEAFWTQEYATEKDFKTNVITAHNTAVNSMGGSAESVGHPEVSHSILSRGESLSAVYGYYIDESLYTDADLDAELQELCVTMADDGDDTFMMLSASPGEENNSVVESTICTKEEFSTEDGDQYVRLLENVMKDRVVCSFPQIDTDIVSHDSCAATIDCSLKVCLGDVLQTVYSDMYTMLLEIVNNIDNSVTHGDSFHLCNGEINTGMEKSLKLCKFDFAGYTTGNSDGNKTLCTICNRHGVDLLINKMEQTGEMWSSCRHINLEPPVFGNVRNYAGDKSTPNILDEKCVLKFDDRSFYRKIDAVTLASVHSSQEASLVTGNTDVQSMIPETVNNSEHYSKNVGIEPVDVKVTVNQLTASQEQEVCYITSTPLENCIIEQCSGIGGRREPGIDEITEMNCTPYKRYSQCGNIDQTADDFDAISDAVERFRYYKEVLLSPIIRNGDWSYEDSLYKHDKNRDISLLEEYIGEDFEEGTPASAIPIVDLDREPVLVEGYKLITSSSSSESGCLLQKDQLNKSEDSLSDILMSEESDGHFQYEDIDNSVIFECGLKSATLMDDKNEVYTEKENLSEITNKYCGNGRMPSFYTFTWISDLSDESAAESIEENDHMKNNARFEHNQEMGNIVAEMQNTSYQKSAKIEVVTNDSDQIQSCYSGNIANSVLNSVDPSSEIELISIVDKNCIDIERGNEVNNTEDVGDQNECLRYSASIDLTPNKYNEETIETVEEQLESASSSFSSTIAIENQNKMRINKTKKAIEEYLDVLCEYTSSPYGCIVGTENQDKTETNETKQTVQSDVLCQSAASDVFDSTVETENEDETKQMVKLQLDVLFKSASNVLDITVQDETKMNETKQTVGVSWDILCEYASSLYESTLESENEDEIKTNETVETGNQDDNKMNETKQTCVVQWDVLCDYASSLYTNVVGTGNQDDTKVNETKEPVVDAQLDLLSDVFDSMVETANQNDICQLHSFNESGYEADVDTQIIDLSDSFLMSEFLTDSSYRETENSDSFLDFVSDVVHFSTTDSGYLCTDSSTPLGHDALKKNCATFTHSEMVDTGYNVPGSNGLRVNGNVETVDTSTDQDVSYLSAESVDDNILMGDDNNNKYSRVFCELQQTVYRDKSDSMCYIPTEEDSQKENIIISPPANPFNLRKKMDIMPPIEEECEN